MAGHCLGTGRQAKLTRRPLRHRSQNCSPQLSRSLRLRVSSLSKVGGSPPLAASAGWLKLHSFLGGQQAASGMGPMYGNQSLGETG